MALDSYSNLKTAILNFLDRDDLADNIDDFIDIAEARHKREILCREMVVRSQASVAGRFLALPTRFNKMKTLRLLTNPLTVLTELNLHEMNRERSDSGNGKPQFFTVHEEIEFDIVPDDTYTAEIIYYANFLPLDDTNTSNGLLVRAPDAYLYGALVASAPFLASDERIQTWDTLYATARDGLLLSDRQARVGTPLYSRVTGSMP
jgi:hypothetical protein